VIGWRCEVEGAAVGTRPDRANNSRNGVTGEGHDVDGWRGEGQSTGVGENEEMGVEETWRRMVGRDFQERGRMGGVHVVGWGGDSRRTGDIAQACNTATGFPQRREFASHGIVK